CGWSLQKNTFKRSTRPTPISHHPFFSRLCLSLSEKHTSLQKNTFDSFRLKTSSLCTLHSSLCIHKTPIVPQFFALYRETEFFISVNIRAILSHGS
ncbi:MAG: hypothetical protein ACXW32_15320, partial [Limisphaerales bacterium]